MVQETADARIEVPENMQVEIDNRRVTVKSGNNELSRKFNIKSVSFEKEANTVVIKVTPANKKNRALVKTIASHIKNMFVGLEKGYEYKLAIVYSHFPMNVSVKENVVEINNFAGEKRPRISKIVGDTKVEVKGKEIFVKGFDKEAVGQTAANLERATRVKKKDRRVFQDGIYLVSKGIVEEKQVN